MSVATQPPSFEEFKSKKTAAGILALLLGTIGVHKFYLGLKKPGLIMLLGTICTCGIGAIAFGPIALVEGIMYLTKSDEDFYQLYGVEKKGWF